jgi:hypothetical protein
MCLASAGSMVLIEGIDATIGKTATVTAAVSSSVNLWRTASLSLISAYL